MTRFSQIAHSIAKLYDPDFNFDPGSPPVRYIEHRLLELAETLDARLTALEAKQAKRPMAIHLETALDEAQADIERLDAELDAARAERDNLAAERERLTAELKERTYERDTLGAFVDALKIDKIKLTIERDNLDGYGEEMGKEANMLKDQRNALAAQVDDLRNVNAGLRKHNASQQALIAAVRSRSLRRLEAIKKQWDVDAALRADNARLRSALKMVEWVKDDFGEYSECPWCHENEETNHRPDCQRQAALR